QCPGASLGKRPSQTKKKKKKRRQSKTVEAVDGGSDLFSPKKRLEPCSEDESSDIDDPGASLGKRPSQTKKKKKKRRRKEDSPRQLKQQAWGVESSHSYSKESQTAEYPVSPSASNCLNRDPSSQGRRYRPDQFDPRLSLYFLSENFYSGVSVSC
ncbi:Hypothetical predicted protein, partial [Scomber scombrus]